MNNNSVPAEKSWVHSPFGWIASAFTAFTLVACSGDIPPPKTEAETTQSRKHYMDWQDCPEDEIEKFGTRETPYCPEQ